MSNEAVTIELFGEGGSKGRPIRYTCADGASISKGTLLKLTDPRTVSASSAAGEIFAGIAAADKLANDGSTNLAVWTDGIFDLQCNGSAITAGQAVVLSGANLIRPVLATDTQLISSCVIIGQALESTSAGTAEAINVRINC